AGDVIEMVGASPLTLKLAARVLAGQGRGAIADAAQRAAALGAVRDEFERGFLYQRIVEHLEPPDAELRGILRDVGRAALVLRRLTADAIEQVLLPVLGRAPDASLAARLFQSLGLHTSLHQVWDNDVLVLHEDLRRPALAALRYDDGELVYAVHESAANYYEQLAQVWARAECVYHRLMVGDPPDVLADQLTATVLSSLERSLTELPPVAAEVVRMRRGEVADRLRQVAETRARELDVESRMDAALREDNLDLAWSLLRGIDQRMETSKLYRMESRLQEALGDLPAAITAQRQDLQAAHKAAHPRRVAAAAVRLSFLLETTGDGTAAIETLRTTAHDALLHGHLALRTELELRRLNVAERTDAWDPNQRDAEEECLLRLLPALSEKELARHEVLYRLLAAALGRREPQRIDIALWRVGVGASISPQAADDIARTVARSPVREQYPFTGSETDIEQQLLRSGRSGVRPLMETFRVALETADVPVMEAIRGLFLWWDNPRPARLAEDDWSLDLRTLDWKREQTGRLARTLEMAYPAHEYLVRLADLSGIPPQDVKWSQLHSDAVRELMEVASGRGLLGKVVETALRDPESASFHDQLKAFRERTV
ncbi:MAG: hypothetical protein J5I93_21195, partial [Pirellulaceae bacterium]|nr:hypothetical protein [Pirellulaceae bacterium]